MEVAFRLALGGGFLLLLSGPSWLLGARVAAELTALVLCRTGRGLVAPFAVLAAALLPFTGHAAAAQPSPAGAELADAVHILAAAMWAGGILALATLKPPDGWRVLEARVLLERFGRIAVIAFGVTALTGLLSASEHLNGLSDLWTTAYGVVLDLKVSGVLVMMVTSGLWRRGLAAGRADGIAAVVVVVATAGLAVLPPPA
jgi:putative copper export protein